MKRLKRLTALVFQSTVFNLLMSLTGGQCAKPPVNQEKYDFSGKKVLLAEDNALNREIAAELLGMGNMAVDCTENGRQWTCLSAPHPACMAVV